MKDKKFEILDALLSAIAETDEWVHLETHDPQILAARKKWEAAIDKIRAVVTDDITGELEDALMGCVAVHVDAAVLFGLCTAIDLFDAMNRPLELSQYILDRRACRKAKAWS